MTIELDDSIAGIWFRNLPDLPGDLMGAVNKKDDKYVFNYRFRYYVDDEAHDSEDVKSWYKVTVNLVDEDGNDQLQQFIETIDELFDTIPIPNPEQSKKYVLLRGSSTLDQFMDEFAALPFVHKQELTDEEAREQFPDYMKDK